MFERELGLLCGCCFLLINGLEAVSAANQAAAWQLPTAESIQASMEQCVIKAAGDEALKLRCLVERLGLWTDEQGYNAKRIAKIFATQKQMEELILVVEYCNNKERRMAQPTQWAYEAYKCATSGRFGRWVEDYLQQQQIYY